MSAVPEPAFVRPSEPDTLDRAAVVAIDRDGSIVGRATFSRLYGLRAEVHLELAPTTAIALALIDALEREARKRRIVRLEIDASTVSDSTVTTLRLWRPLTDEIRASHRYLTWSTTLVNS
jgi:hypothetical protein